MTIKMDAFKPLYITGAGTCCAVGMSVIAMDCALRAGVDHFQSSHFFDKHREPLRAAQLPDDGLRGNARLARFCTIAIDECQTNAAANNQQTIDWSQVPLLLLAAERERPHTDDQRYQKIFALIQTQLGMSFHPASRIIPAGRAGLGLALHEANQLLSTPPIKHVLIAGVDSYLDSHTINYLMQHNRVRTSSNSDGFIPGEAAGAVLVSQTTTQENHHLIAGLGLSEETGKPDGSVPSKATGLSQALTQALEQAGLPIKNYTLRFSDQNGESFFTREAAHAFTRVGMNGLQKLDALTTADCTGEIGAATGPLILAWATRKLVASQQAILHLANDDGLRMAVCIAHRRFTQQEKAA
jgi:3-oxoacyl-[acyl-carrier-protein] synthase I